MPRVRGQTKAQSAFLAEMYELGKSDCGNAFELSDWPIQEADSADEVFELGKSALLDYEDDWYKQNEDPVAEAKDLGLAKETAFAGWVAGWKECALPRIAKAISNDRDERKSNKHLFYLSDHPGGITYFESFDKFEDALDMLARLPNGSIAYGDANGPDFQLVMASPQWNPKLLWVFEQIVPKATKDAAWHVMTTQVLGQPFHRRPSGTIEEMDRRFAETIAELKRRGYRWDEKDVTKNPNGKTRKKRNPSGKDVSFWDLIREEDPRAMDIAEDLVERGWKLREMAGGLRALHFNFWLEPSASAPTTEWRHSSVSVLDAGADQKPGIAWVVFKVDLGTTRLKFERKYSIGGRKRVPIRDEKYDAVRKVAVSKAWAVAKAIKTLPLDYPPEDLAALVEPIIDVKDTVTLTPAELY